MGKLWFFGDSYCGDNKNWVSQISRNLNQEVENLGIVGSSLQFLIHDLNVKSYRIKKEDTVIVLITSPERDYLGDKYPHHFMAGDDIKTRFENLKQHLKNQITSDEIREIDNMANAYEDYTKFLYNPVQKTLNSQALVCHLLNDILPSLNTKRYQYFFSIYPEHYTDYKFYNKSHIRKNETGLIQLTHRYLETIYPNITGDQILEYIRTPNHWIDSPEYEYLFWKTFNPLLKTIGADTPI